MVSWKGKGCAIPHWSAAMSPGFGPCVKGADHILCDTTAWLLLFVMFWNLVEFVAQ